MTRNGSTGGTGSPGARGRPDGRAPAGMAAILAAVALLLAGCTGTMPAPVGTTAAPAAAVAYNPAAPFSVGLVPDRAPPVRLGETLGFGLSSSVDGYGHLYLVSTSGAVMALSENLALRAGARTAFPPPGSGFALRARPPAGIERALLLVTRRPFAGFAGGAAAQGPVQLAVGPGDFIRRLNAAAASLPRRGWVLAEARIAVIAP